MALTALIDNTYFQSHPLYIVNDSINNKLNNELILNVQEDTARKLLGDVLYFEFDADFNGTDFDTQKWTDFVDGYTFQVDSKNVNWLGFKNMLKYFVFFEYQKYNQVQNSNLGNINPDFENAKHSFDFTNEIKQYNKGVDLYGYDWGNLFQEYSIYNYEYWLKYKKYYISCFNDNIEKVKPTAYNFIYNRRTEFENWEFTVLGYANTFGI